MFSKTQLCDDLGYNFTEFFEDVEQWVEEFFFEYHYLKFSLKSKGRHNFSIKYDTEKFSMKFSHNIKTLERGRILLEFTPKPKYDESEVWCITEPVSIVYSEVDY